VPRALARPLPTRGADSRGRPTARSASVRMFEKAADDRRGHRAVRHPSFDRAGWIRAGQLTAHEAKAKHGARYVVEEDDLAATGGLEAATPNGSSCVHGDAQALPRGEALVGPSQSG